MHAVAFNVAVVAYVCAAGLALAHLIQREEIVHRLASVSALAGWVAHTVGMILMSVDLGRPPLGNLAEAISMAVWVVVLLEMWIERQYDVKVLGAFVFPIVVLLSLKTTAAKTAGFGPALHSAWIWVHITLALVGIAAFVLNFAGALMYLLQERQLKGKRPGRLYYRLPSLPTLDRKSVV